MNVFDIIGPIMIGPSSSHTAGAVRLGRVAWKILGQKAVKAKLCFLVHLQKHMKDMAQTRL